MCHDMKSGRKMGEIRIYEGLKIAKSDFTLLGPILYAGTKNDLWSLCNNFVVVRAILVKFGRIVGTIIEFYFCKLYKKYLQ